MNSIREGQTNVVVLILRFLAHPLVSPYVGQSVFLAET